MPRSGVDYGSQLCLSRRHGRISVPACSASRSASVTPVAWHACGSEAAPW